MITLIDKLSDAYAKYYSPTEHIPVDEFIVLFKVGVIFRQCVPRNVNGLGQKSTRCLFLKDVLNVTVCLGKDRKYATGPVASACVTIAGLTTRIENMRHKLDSVFILFLY